MRALMITGIFVLAAACAGQMPPGKNPGDNVATACIDVSGSQEVVSCIKHGEAMFDKDEGFCTCPTGASRIKATPCAPGEKQPIETAEYRAALRDLSKDGTLIGDTYQGRRICVEQGRT